jgi:hypothetical protein
MEIIALLLIIIAIVFIVMINQILKSKDNVDLTVNLKKGEMNLKKRRLGQ